jgi:Uma2 family endonuclease
MTDQVKTGVSMAELMSREWVEVVDGEIVEIDIMTAGFMHKVITDNAFRLLDPYAREHQLGRVFNDGLTYALHVDESGVQVARLADCSFIRRENLKRDFNLTEAYPGTPDLAIEVVSPTERTDRLMGKVSDYLHYGTEQVWALYPLLRELHVYFRDDNRPRIYKENDTLEPEALFPGLKIKIADFFVDEQ